MLDDISASFLVIMSAKSENASKIGFAILPATVNRYNVIVAQAI